MKETIEWLTMYFSRQRNSNPHSGQFGLHSNWKQYHQPLVGFLGYIMLNTIILEAHRVVEASLDVEQGRLPAAAALNQNLILSEDCQTLQVWGHRKFKDIVTRYIQWCQK